MGAGRVGPKQRRVIFPGTALLQQQAVPAGQENRDGLMSNAGEVRLQLGDGVGRTSVIKADDQVGQAVLECGRR